MYSNKSKPLLPKDKNLASQSVSGGAAPADAASGTKEETLSPGPDYVKLVRFLIEPFLESPDALKVDCEISPSRPRVWVRLAFETGDKGRVYGRGGRNLQAITTVLTAVAKAAGQSLYLDVYGGFKEASDRSVSPGSANRTIQETPNEDSAPVVPKSRKTIKPPSRDAPILKPSRQNGEGGI